MRDPMRWYSTTRHAVGVALRVRSWPSRRYMRRLQRENSELQAQLDLQPCDLRPLVAAVDATVVALEETVGARHLRAVR